MSLFRSVALVALLAGCTFAPTPQAATRTSRRTTSLANHTSAITVAFAKDEQSVTVHYAGRVWNLARPVVSPWAYKAKGRVYWVASNGHDRNAGTSARPLGSINAAMQRARAGDIVYVRAGTYVETLTIRKSGTKARPIILSCAPGDLGKVKITPSKEYVTKNPHGAVITMTLGASHIWVNGLVIEGPKGRPEAPKMETYGANGITWSDKGGPGCRATNNVVYGNVHCGIKEMNHGGHGMLIEANVIFNNGSESRDHGIYMPASDVVMNGNIIFDNAGYGIHSYSSPKNQTITRNICFGHKQCGIILAGSDNKVYHNTCVNNARGIFYFRGGCKNNDVRNNIFAFNKADCDWDNGGGKEGDPSANRDDYNCYYPGKPDRRIHPGTHELFANPRFRDAKKGDFRLSERSPCRGKGAIVGLSTDKKPNLGAFFKASGGGSSVSLRSGSAENP